MPTSAELSKCDNPGSAASIYFNSADTGVAYDCTAAVWVRHKGVVGDLSINETEPENKLGRRDPGQIVDEYVSGKIALDISGTQAYDIDYEGCDALNKARNGNPAVDLLVLSGLISTLGSAGWRGKFRNFDRSASFPEEGAATQNFKLMPAACQLVACKVRPVRVNVANAIADYTPGLLPFLIGMSSLVGSITII